MHDDSHPRGFWKIARIKSLIVGKDGRVRGAVLRVASTGRRESILQRPLQRIYPLEIKNLTPGEEESGSDNEAVPEHSDPTVEAEQDAAPPSSGRPTRAAAQRSRDLNQAITLYEQDEFSD